jgi:hypothetical protein
MSEKITFQLIFDKAWQAFIIEDKPPAVNLFGSCVYDDGKGNCCAIGLVLPEGHNSRRGSVRFCTLVYMYPELFDKEVIATSSIRLNSFQKRLHDGLVSFGSWAYTKEERKQRYIQVAKDYNLTIPGEQNDK